MSIFSTMSIYNKEIQRINSMQKWKDFICTVRGPHSLDRPEVQKVLLESTLPQLLEKSRFFQKGNNIIRESARDLLILKDLNWVDIFSDGWGTPLSSVRKYFEGEKYTCELCGKEYCKKKDRGEPDMLAVAEKNDVGRIRRRRR